MPELGIDPNVLEKPDDKDYDSAGYDTSTESLASSIYQYLFENGRRYHSYYGTEKYFLPTDETEQDRYVVGMVEQLNGWSDKFSLDLHHEIMTLAWENNLYKAPLTDPRRILDIGTGTRIWGIDMAEKFPNAEVIGTDLSPVQPNWAPQNCNFEVDDAMSEWTYLDNSFDYIHARNICSGVSDWEHLMSQMMRCTKPGGYVEMCEYSLMAQSDDGSMKLDNPIKIYIDLLRESMVKIGRSPPEPSFLKSLLDKSGFEEVTTSKVKEPLGPWAKDPRMKRIGAMVLLHSETVFESCGISVIVLWWLLETKIIISTVSTTEHMAESLVIEGFLPGTKQLY